MNNFNSLDLFPISELLSKEFRFYVPAYQRGYRWTADQAIQLIDDLLEFYRYHYSKDNQKFYCLQPLVVKQKLISEGNTEKAYLEVIDGQQRLTTILIILQVLHLLAYEKFHGKENVQADSVNIVPEAFSIKYETRPSSDEWLEEVNAVVYDTQAFDCFDSKNCDYSHFAEVFHAVYHRLKKLEEDQRNDFHKVLRRGTKFIWYYPSSNCGTNAEVFDRLNDGKIGLNNAELIKALLLQRNNWVNSDPSHCQSLALEWNAVENALQQKEFWGFIYSSQHPYEYDTHIEYILDLLQHKDASHKEKQFYTFNRYLDDYRQMMNGDGKDDSGTRSDWAKGKWLEAKSLFDTLTEWYRDKKLYHRIGYILEYAPGETVLTLKEKLDGKKHRERIECLNGIIRENVKNISSTKLFHGRKELSQILFLYNILLEDKRIADNARFSFADYKGVRKNSGWDQEHVASNTDFAPDPKKQIELAMDIIELITGYMPQKDENTGYHLCGECLLDDKEKEICDYAIKLLNKVDFEDYSKLSDEEMKQRKENIQDLYNSVVDYFETDSDGFGLSMVGNKEVEEKNFIWNFVLLNSSTNRSYGNSIYPVKRRRILQDEFNVYTPVGTRNVFEKAYSKKINQIMCWTKTDALAYWKDLQTVVSPYVKLSLPFEIYE